MHVSGWHEATKQLQAQGKLQMVGIIQEQHPDRCRLFLQWKQMDWPILVDSLNLLEVTAVPITLAIDEHGIIRHKGLSLQEAETIEEIFLNQSFDAPEDERRSASVNPASPDIESLRAAAERGSEQDLRQYANQLTIWGGPEQMGAAIRAYQDVIAVDRGHDPDGFDPDHFRLGVAFRKRYDSDYREASDFQRAVQHWKIALDLDPNQYIWRRRIQQYGPRLDKPYPFYDWVPQAWAAISTRGETPLELAVEPRGAEFAKPLEHFETGVDPVEEPDPGGRIQRDEGQFVHAEATVVPPVVAPGETVRVHVTMRPNLETKSHWNNEAEELAYWVEPPEDWEADGRYLTHPIPPEVVSLEPRSIEFELRCPNDAGSGTVEVPSYALYYVCEDVNGTCLYRRQDVMVKVQVR